MAEGEKGAKSRPTVPKLKTPLALVISSNPSSSLHQRPLGTPPPTSLRKSRQHQSQDQMSNVSSTSTSSFFPQISVEKCPEEDSDEGQLQFPTESSRSKASKETDGSNSMSGQNNVEAAGLTPPQRIQTAGSGDVVFELSTAQGLQLANVSAKGKGAESI